MLEVAVRAESSIEARRVRHAYHWCEDTEEECKCMNNDNRFFISSGYFSGRQMTCRWLERKQHRHFNQCRQEDFINNCPLSCGKCDGKPIPSTDAIERTSFNNEMASPEVTPRKCKDSTKSFKIKSVAAIKREKNCKWAGKNPSRCSIVEVRKKCPVICNTCGCFDNKKSFGLFAKNKQSMIMKSCKWVKRRDTWWRCTTFQAAMINCPQTCGHKCPREKFVEKDPVTQSEITTTSPTKKPSLLPSTAPSLTPTTNPTKKLSLLPSTVPSSTPSILSSVLPTSVPSSESSSPSLNPIIPNTCQTDGFIGETLYALHGRKESGIFCYKAELFTGGTFSVDYTNSDCDKESFTESKILSHYDSHDSKRIKFRKGDSAEWDGYFVLTSDPSVDKLDYTIVKNEERQKIFIVHLHFPSCST